MSDELIFYVGAVEDVYTTVTGFMVAGQPADPTSYDAYQALIADGESVADAAWQDAAWIDGASPPLCMSTFGEDVPLTEGLWWLYVKLQGTRERLPRQVCRVRVKATP